ncbi:T9SS type A sorting domain-containing protein [Neolewinella persica]|uniref:T9SS type A sorting domain-containing protein n=1 Tax=Neolewinella persica TaxID=70998 RepID=UPI00035D41FE|nr:T9SS type A sorting domain-containing protein [Neolewinella persica]
MRVLLLLLFSISLSAQSEVLVYETFDYAAYNPMFCLGDTINGWTGPWTRETGDDAIIRGGDLVPTTVIPTSGRASLEFIRAGIRYNRPIDLIEDDGQALWISYDVDFRAGSVANNVGNVTFTRGSNQVFTVGRKFGNRKIGLVWPGAGNYNTDIDAEGLHRLVVKIQFSGDSGDELAWLWVDPDTFNDAGEPTAETADITVPTTGLPGLRLNIGIDGVQLKVEGTPPLEVDFDNLILGRTFRAVDPDYIVGTRNVSQVKFPVKLFPNPTNGPIGIEWEMPMTGPLAISLYDHTGRRLRQFATRSYPAGPQHITLSLADRKLPAGSYLLRLATPGFQTTQPIIYQPQ